MGVGTRSASTAMSVGELQEAKDMRMLSVATAAISSTETGLERTDEKGHLTTGAWVGMGVGLACATILSVRIARMPSKPQHDDADGGGGGGEDRSLLPRPSAVVRGMEVMPGCSANVYYGALDDSGGVAAAAKEEEEEDLDVTLENIESSRSIVRSW